MVMMAKTEFCWQCSLTVSGHPISFIANPKHSPPGMFAGIPIIEVAGGSEHSDICLLPSCYSTAEWVELAAAEEDTMQQWIEFLGHLHNSYTLLVPGLLLLLAYAVYLGVGCLLYGKKKDRKVADILVSIRVPSEEICNMVFQELRNALPLLSRLYGPLTLNLDSDSKLIAVIVRPHLEKQKFRLLQFVRDLLSPATVSRCINNIHHKVTIFAVHGASTALLKTTLKDVISRKSADLSGSNIGKVTLKFSGHVDQMTLLKSLVSAQPQLTDLFQDHGFNLTDVRRGSIKFRFDFHHNASVFDDLALQGRIQEFVKNLCSRQEFQRLASQEKVQVEFVCKTKMAKVSVIQAENVYVQIGLQNTVLIGDSSPHSAEDDTNDREFREGEETHVNAIHSDLVSYNFVSISPHPQLVQVEGQDQADRHTGIANGYIASDCRVITVAIRCCDKKTARHLHKEWSNILPLLQRLWPCCKLKKDQSWKVWWELTYRRNEREEEEEEDVLPDLSLFVNDIFRTERLQEIRALNEVEVGISVKSLGANRAVSFDQRSDRYRLLKQVASFFVRAFIWIALITLLVLKARDQTDGVNFCLFLFVIGLCFVR